jgi:hypothetical protein
MISNFFSLKKSGASHIEMILAFILFSGFVFFLFYFFQPFQTQTLQDAVLVSLKDSFFNNVSVNLTTVLVNFSDKHGAINPCRLPDSNISGTGRMGVLNISTSRPEFYYLYYSDSLDFPRPGLLNCSLDYQIGNINNLIVLSDYSLKNIEQRYNTDYVGLKSDLGLPNNADFSISTKEYSMERQTPEKVKVIAGVYRRLILYGNGTLINRDFIIKVW